MRNKIDILEIEIKKNVACEDHKEIVWWHQQPCGEYMVSNSKRQISIQKLEKGLCPGVDREWIRRKEEGSLKWQ